MSKRIQEMLPGHTFWYAMQRATVLRQIKRDTNNDQTEIRTQGGTVIITSGLDPRIHAMTKADLSRHTQLLHQALHG